MVPTPFTIIHMHSPLGLDQRYVITFRNDDREMWFWVYLLPTISPSARSLCLSASPCLVPISKSQLVSLCLYLTESTWEHRWHPLRLVLTHRCSALPVLRKLSYNDKLYRPLTYIKCNADLFGYYYFCLVILFYIRCPTMQFYTNLDHLSSWRQTSTNHSTNNSRK